MKSLSGNSETLSDKKPFVIAIDGPAASGKSTAAYLLAKELGFIYMDTGAMYRTLTWKTLQNHIDLEDVKSLCEIAENTHIKLFSRTDGPGVLVYVDGKEISTLLRTPGINKWVSIVSKVPGVRVAMVKMQRSMAREKSIVVEGRDIGTVVFPEADVKIFLVASLKERARRRWKELQKKGIFCIKEDVERELQSRDKLDSERKVAPLKKALDAILVDNTHLEIIPTFKKLLNIVKLKIKN